MSACPSASDWLVDSTLNSIYRPVLLLTLFRIADSLRRTTWSERAIRIRTWLESAVYGIMTVWTLAVRTVFGLIHGWLWMHCGVFGLDGGAYTTHNTHTQVCVDLEEHGTLAKVLTTSAV